MAKNKLVIVESPSKAKTVEKYLGKGYKVAASMGHIRDLPKSKLGVDVEHGFEPVYVEDPKKEEVIKSLKSAAKSASIVYLAGDPDREGEAISWHLANILGIDDTKPVRVTFNEITEQGVKEGMAHPRPIDLDLVNAQQSRRILDRIVGYKLSPFLWRKVKRGLSAGRVQSVAVKMIVDREREINAFVPEEYWSVEAKFTAPPSRKQFDASFYSMDGKKLKIKTRAGADTVVERSKNAQFTVVSVKNSKRKRSPAPPFTTSTMQQEASRKMGFQTQRTMRAAQQLYEGVDVEGMGAVGLITYMRTDSLRISDTARAAASEYIERSYGKEYLPDKPQVYKTKKNVQDAHEAIRPSTPSITPAQVKDSLTPDQYKLYKLIWERFIASQMANEILDTVAVEIEGDGLRYKASGFTVNFKGFAVLYEESKEEGEKELPTLKQGDKLSLKAVEGKQHFTQPPARYTEGSFIKALEENGIGRPSTYAPTITTITSRRYVEHEGKALKPTNLGEVI
ncbi:MAG: type I DNA topoisomerase, partial [Oscillospiraceae bacterium]|nr:type I DNA topoisomerase [Oscillospiraceae bacterium]